MESPETRYAKTADGHSIAYQVFGTGADLLFVPGYISNLELNWDLPAYAGLLQRLASFSRVIAVDRRGTGLSDRLSPGDEPPLEILMEDLGRVLDEVGSERATVVGLLDGGYLCMLFAATHPERTRALVLYGTSASGKWSPDYPWQWKPDRWESYFDEMASGWGTQQYAGDGLGWYAPSAYQDEATRRWWGRYQRLAASPGSAIALERLYSQTDVRHILPSIRVPTLVLHRRGDPVEPVEGARSIAREIPGAKYVELERGRCPVRGRATRTPSSTRSRSSSPGCRTSAGAGSPARDGLVHRHRRIDRAGGRVSRRRGWKDLLGEHDAIVRRRARSARGTEISTRQAMGSSRRSTDRPAAVGCAWADRRGARDRWACRSRAGVHTGEIEFARRQPRVASRSTSVQGSQRSAGASEVLVSRTVKDLTAGSGLVFEDAGQHDLKGVPDRWRLYRVVDLR